MSRIKSFLRKNWMKAILAVVALAALVVVITLAFRPRPATGEGEVTFIVLETHKEGEATFITWGIEKKVKFKKGDEAFELFKDQEEFDVDYSESELGVMINGINGVFGEYTGEDHEDGYQIWTYWALYEDGEYSTKGIDGIKLTDGIVIEFRFE